MPNLSLLDFILFLYFLLASAAIVIFAFLLEKSRKKSLQLQTTNSEVNKRLELLADQLKLIQQKNSSGQSISETESIYNQIDAGIIILSGSFTVISINPYAERILGVDKKDVLTSAFNDVVKMEDGFGKPETYALKQALSGKSTSLPIWTYIVVKNQKIPIIGTFSPLGNTHGITQILFHFINAEYQHNYISELENKLSNIMSQMADKTEQYNNLLRNTTLSAKLIDVMDLGLVIMSTDGQIVQINPFALHLMGLLRDNCLHKPYKEVFTVKNQSGNVDFSAVKSALEGKTSQLSKWSRIETKSNNFVVSGGAIPINSDKSNMYVCFYFTDVTDQFNEQTEERTFFSSAAHDLRSPLTTIRGVTEVLQSSFDKMPADQVREMLTGANDSAVHLIDLVNDLLNVSRIDQGRVSAVKSAFDIVKVTKEIVANMQVPAKNKHLYLNYDITDTDITRAYGDENKTIDVITNLISNAIKYTQEGGVTVTQKQENGKIITMVEDTGIGISPENQKLLFHKFQQIGTSRFQPMTKSTGLGLYIAKKFALLMGGEVMLERSALEKGSVFKFILPEAP